jgi:molecular chaperone HtpG
LISNGTDATLKLKHLTNIEATVEYGKPKLKKIDKEGKKTAHYRQGINDCCRGRKYINQLAFLVLKNFRKIQRHCKDSGIIGHFGLGFYSAFMVASKVEIIQSLKTNLLHTGFVW